MSYVCPGHDIGGLCMLFTIFLPGKVARCLCTDINKRVNLCYWVVYGITQGCAVQAGHDVAAS